MDEPYQCLILLQPSTFKIYVDLTNRLISHDIYSDQYLNLLNTHLNGAVINYWSYNSNHYQASTITIVIRDIQGYKIGFKSTRFPLVYSRLENVCMAPLSYTWIDLPPSSTEYTTGQLY